MVLNMSFPKEFQINLYDMVHHLPDMAYLSVGGKFITGNEFMRKCAGFRSIEDLEGRAYQDINCEAVQLHEKFFADDIHVLRSKKPLTQLAYLKYANDEDKLLMGRKTPLALNQADPMILAEYLDITQKNLFNFHVILDLDKKFIERKKRQFVYDITDNYSLENFHLSKRESECLFFILRGKSTKAISRILDLSVRTVETYIAALKDKFDVNTIPQLMVKALSLGCLDRIPESLLSMLDA